MFQFDDVIMAIPNLHTNWLILKEPCVYEWAVRDPKHRKLYEKRLLNIR